MELVRFGFKRPPIVSALVCSLGVRSLSVFSSGPALVRKYSTEEGKSENRANETKHFMPKEEGAEAGGSDGEQTEETTHFGYKEVSKSKKTGMVGSVFSSVADSYDVMNDAMSFGIHRWWKCHFVQQLPIEAGMKFLDMAGGTGDIAFRIIDRLRKSDAADENSEVLVCDINEKMLHVGEMRAEKRDLLNIPNVDVRFQRENAEALDDIPDNYFDCYTIAFGIRNVTDIPKALREAHRVLKPGGIFSCLEFSRVVVPGFATLYDLYSWNVIPLMGELIAKDRHSYEYLVESIRKFPAQHEFEDMIGKAGFKQVRYENLMGGIVAIHSAFKV